MNNDQTEEKLKIENEIATLKREHKYALENLNRVKSDTNDIIAVKERVTAEIAERQGDLSKILNEISNEKLAWATKRHEELSELENKQSEVQNVLNRKAELNEQEEVIRKLEASEIDARNEARRLELKNQQEIDGIEAEKRRIANLEKELEQKSQEIEKDRQDFKKRVEKVMKEVDKL